LVLAAGSDRANATTTLAGASAESLASPVARDDRGPTRIGEVAFDAAVRAIVSRRPAVGLALGVLVGGRLELFHGHGLADIASKTPVTEGTVFRIGSVTKLFTAIAVMQLAEQGRVDLDVPAKEYLRAYRLVENGFRPPTVRHLLTHTAGIPDMRHASDLLHAGLTPDDGRPPLLSVPVGEALPSLAKYYRDGLRVVIEPGTAFAYCNHGFATLGQIVEDVSGLPLERYFRECIFEPLSMADTDLVRSEHVAARLATGYVLRRRGATLVSDREWIGAGGGGVYSTVRDLARFAAALLEGGANEHGSVLEPATLATMFAPHFQPDPRLSGMGLGFFRSDVSGHRIVYHDGILPGFNSELLIAPDDGVALVALTNGAPGAFGWLGLELEGLLHQVLDLSDEPDPDVVPQHPEIWRELCGRYVYPPRIADLRERLMLGAGAEVLVRSGKLLVRILTPVPALYRGLPLLPDDPTDPYVFRLDLRPYGMAMVRVVFADVVGGRARAVHTDLGGQPWSVARAPATGRRPAWLASIVGPLAVTGVVALLARRRRGRPA
jgi:CubicO group peptidase (beta-lactamase class C family)